MINYKLNIRIGILLFCLLCFNPKIVAQNIFFPATGYSDVGKESVEKLSKPILDLNKNIHFKSVHLNESKLRQISANGNKILEIVFDHKANIPSADFEFNPINLSANIGIAISVQNCGASEIALEGYCYNKKDSVSIKDGAQFFNRSMIVLKPGESDNLVITLSRTADCLPQYISNYFKGMFGLPGGYIRRKTGIDLSRITNICLFAQSVEENHKICLKSISAVGNYNLPSEEILKSGFFPFVDKFGQYMHADWKYKVKTDSDIITQKEQERNDLDIHKGVTSWDEYGGWSDGPSLQATGHFRVEKYNNKWWLVDPGGRLFWSHGINQIGFHQRTQIRGRDNYFTKVPLYDDFYMQNLLIKYKASDLQDSIVMITFKRLKSWGINTLANGADFLLSSGGKIPYTVGIPSKISNPLSETLDEDAFRAGFIRQLQEFNIARINADPWCVGIFVDNELAWPSANQKKVIEAYFRIIHEELHHLAPNKLYLGCRINSPNFNRIAFEACAKYCDVISINHYDYNISDFKGTEGIDKPLIIGEFHYGALDRGLFHTGLRSVPNQKQRARVYKHFIDQCLANQYVVGAHWFQYIDQLCTGRGDGENYQIGFVDICDRPYSEMIDASREIGGYMYKSRFNDRYKCENEEK